MGVPGFFAWLFKKYKITIKKLDNDIDTLYIDANCLFHPQCFQVLTHYGNIELKILEKYMFDRIILYLDYLIEKVNPKKIYIAVDGVAPMAKMNQQRKRRFKSIYDNNIRNKIKMKYGINENTIWSNTCITPGTKFMEKLHQRLLTYIKTKSNIIYSSYHTPGEGEHKILQDIKNESGTHVIYGLDADLIFLSLACKKNVYLMRESSMFDQNSKDNDTDINNVYESFNYVPINKLKEYINIEVSNRTQITDDYCDDFIFISMLLGNDFIPHIPSIDIKTNGMDLLLKVYGKTYNGTKLIEISDDVKINKEFYARFIVELSKFEKYYFENILPKFDERIKNKICRKETDVDIELWNYDYLKYYKFDPVQLGVGNPMEYKYRYYEHYFNISTFYEQGVKSICDEYFRAILWNAYYYFLKCPNWTWQYPFTHSPFMTDLAIHINNNNIDYTFENDKNILPYSQLLSVLPSACSYLLPESYKNLMMDPESPIIDYYPEEIYQDVLHKDAHFKSIPMISSVDIDRINDAIINLKLTKNEQLRNANCDVFIN